MGYIPKNTITQIFRIIISFSVSSMYEVILNSNIPISGFFKISLKREIIGEFR